MNWKSSPRIVTTSFLAFGVAVLCLAGCGGLPSTVPASGTVTFQGKPVQGANVTFSRDSGNANKGEIATGTTDASGRYELMTNFGSQGSSKGVAPGKYNVAISKQIPPEGMSFEKYQALVEAARKVGETGAMVPASQQPPPTTEQFPNHATVGKSVLNAEVPAGGSTSLDFSIK